MDSWHPIIDRDDPRWADVELYADGKGLRPHSVYKYTDQIYKIVQFYDVYKRIGPGPRKSQEHYDHKLDSSLSRTRRLILEKALCNPWEWFCTFTIAEAKHDRKDLVKWRDSFTQWMRDQRKKGYPIQYLIVPERHADGSWHAHGLLSGLPEDQLILFRDMDRAGYRLPSGRRLPRKLRNSKYRNWPAYQEKFGFCSFGKIVNPIAAGFYITKYITKDNDRMVQDLGLHSYYVSRGLQGASKHIDFYGRYEEIDKFLVNKYDFCATGMTHFKDGLGWDFCLDYSNIEPLPLFSDEETEKSAPEIEADDYYDFEQIVLQM